MKKYGLNEFAQLAEITAAIRVAISLIWVGFELRLNTNEVRSANAMELINMATQNQMMLATSDVGEIFAKLSNGEDLSPDEAARVGLLFNGLFQEVESAHYQLSQSRLDPQIASAWDQRPISLLSNPVARNYWEANKILYTDRFSEHVKSIISSRLTR